MLPPNYEAPVYIKEMRLNMYISLINSEVKLTHQKLTRWVIQARKGDASTPVHVVIHTYRNDDNGDYILSNKDKKIVATKFDGEYKYSKWIIFNSTSGIDQKTLLINLDESSNNKSLYAVVDSRLSIMLLTAKQTRDLSVMPADIMIIYPK